MDYLRRPLADFFLAGFLADFLAGFLAAFFFDVGFDFLAADFVVTAAFVLDFNDFAAFLAFLAALPAAALTLPAILGAAFETVWAIAGAFAPATPPTTAPTAAPTGPTSEPAAAPAAAPPTMPAPEIDVEFSLVLVSLFMVRVLLSLNEQLSGRIVPRVEPRCNQKSGIVDSLSRH